MCFPKRKSMIGSVGKGGRTPSNGSEIETPMGTPSKKPLFYSSPIHVEMKPEEVQNRLAPVIKNLCDSQEPLSKTGGSSDLLAAKLAEKNKLDEANVSGENTCEDDANYYHLRKDILAIVDKSKRKEKKKKLKDDDTLYEKSKIPIVEEVKKKVKTVYKRDERQSKSSSKSKSAEEIKSKEDYDTGEVNEHNFMYNLKEIDYCTHDMMRCIEEDNLYKNIYDDSKLPEKVEPYGELDLLKRRKYASCKVLRRNTLISTILSMPSADELEAATTATAKDATDHVAINFLPPITLMKFLEEGHEDITNIETSNRLTPATDGHTVSASQRTPNKIPNETKPGETSTSRKKKKENDKDKKSDEKVKNDGMNEKTCDESEKKTAEEL